MKTEYEIKFLDVDIEEIRKILAQKGAKMTLPMTLMRRMIIKTEEMARNRAYLRLRDEGDKIALTYKQFISDEIGGAQESEIVVNDFDETANMLVNHMKIPLISYQESRREVWVLDDVEIAIDEWPWIKPYIEIEGKSEDIVRNITKKLGFDWEKGCFGSLSTAYIAEYPHLTEEIIFAVPEYKFENPLPNVFLINSLKK